MQGNSKAKRPAQSRQTQAESPDITAASDPSGPMDIDGPDVKAVSRPIPDSKVQLGAKGILGKDQQARKGSPGEDFSPHNRRIWNPLPPTAIALSVKTVPASRVC